MDPTLKTKTITTLKAILPDLSRQVLARMVSGEQMKTVEIALKDGTYDYVFS